MDSSVEGGLQSQTREVCFQVREGEHRLRLDQLLAERIPELSRMRLRLILDAEGVAVDGLPQAAGYRVRTAETVRLAVPEGEVTAMTPEDLPLSVLFEDAELVVVEKPEGMVAHPVGRHRTGTLANALAYHFNVRGASDRPDQPPIRPGIVHRLDRATSGVMVIAKTQRSLSRLTVAFQERRVEKRYLALVHGRVAEAAGDWHAPIGKEFGENPAWGIRESGKPGHSRYQVRERFPEHTLLELEPVTGRTNQLRLHTAHFGHPIAGDELFGRGAEPALGRLFLHAHRLTFPHPATGERLTFESPLPEVLAAYLEGLRSGLFSAERAEAAEKTGG